MLALRSTRHLPASWRERGLAMDWIWSWQLDTPAPGRTRVVQRNRLRLRPRWFEWAFLAAIVPADFVMAERGTAAHRLHSRRIVFVAYGQRHQLLDQTGAGTAGSGSLGVGTHVV